MRNCGDSVDREVDRLHHALVRIAGTIALEQLQLHMVERIDVGKAVADSARKRGVALQEGALLKNGQQRFLRTLPLCRKAREDGLPSSSPQPACPHLLGQGSLGLATGACIPFDYRDTLSFTVPVFSNSKT